jgi:hypothetical protein
MHISRLVTAWAAASALGLAGAAPSPRVANVAVESPRARQDTLPPAPDPLPVLDLEHRAVPWPVYYSKVAPVGLDSDERYQIEEGWRKTHQISEVGMGFAFRAFPR